MERKTSVVSEFWLPPDLDPKDFEREFKFFFVGGEARHIPLVPDAHPRGVPDGSHYFQLVVPKDKMDKYYPFLQEYASKHDCDIQKFPASGFGFAHGG
jgi:hypothetical protein